MECPLGYGKKNDTDCEHSELSRDRKESPIPTKQGGRWWYPSPHQFYTATKAKGHSIAQEQIPVIVDIHNAVNDEAWKRITTLEHKYHADCTDVRLVRFVGRPGNRTPKSWFMEYLAGWQPPFDRHDWLIDRCGKAQVRYVVDFYDGKTVPNRPELVPVFIDARPAIDSIQNFLDRIKMLLKL